MYNDSALLFCVLDKPLSGWCSVLEEKVETFALASCGKGERQKGQSFTFFLAFSLISSEFLPPQRYKIKRSNIPFNLQCTLKRNATWNKHSVNLHVKKETVSSVNLC